MKQISDKYSKLVRDGRQHNFSTATSSMNWYLDRIKSANIKQYEHQHNPFEAPKSLMNNIVLFNYSAGNNTQVHEVNPLVYPVSLSKGGFTGLNFHHLPHTYRALLFDSLFSGEGLRGNALQKLTGAVTRHYSFNNIKSLQVIPHDQWHLALFLPVEKFQRPPVIKK